MQSSKCCVDKNRITHAIFAGAVVMVVVFVISLFLPKEWLVSGKIVVFPSGQPASASVNLIPETWNTAEIIKSESFRKNSFGDQDMNFASARVVKNSSMVFVKFRSSESDIQAYEDLIVKIPSQVNDYARDLYSGSPFKYKLASDPEISASPVSPNLLLNALLGFIAGLIIYIIYWKGFESRRIKVEETEVDEKKKSEIVSPEIKPTEDKVGEGKVVMENGRPAYIPKKSDEGKSSAPENLPIAGEPSDEEVKDRLNRLMRGEL